MPDKSVQPAKRKRLWWRALLGLVAAVALVMLVVNPELAAAGFLFDPIVLDVAIIFFGTQLVLFRDQIRLFLIVTGSGITRCWKALRRSR